MPTSPSPLSPVTLTTTPTEWQATLIVTALRDAGLNAHVAGANLVGMRAEIPAVASVMVPLRELAQARVVLDSIRSAKGDIDWDGVDVGAPDAAEADDHDPVTARQKSARWVIVVVVIATLALVALLLLNGLITRR